MAFRGEKQMVGDRVRRNVEHCRHMAERATSEEVREIYRRALMDWQGVASATVLRPDLSEQID
jgi:hypothetical protein